MTLGGNPLEKQPLSSPIPLASFACHAAGDSAQQWQVLAPSGEVAVECEEPMAVVQTELSFHQQ